MGSIEHRSFDSKSSNELEVTPTKSDPNVSEAVASGSMDKTPSFSPPSEADDDEEKCIDCSSEIGMDLSPERKSMDSRSSFLSSSDQSAATHRQTMMSDTSQT